MDGWHPSFFQVRLEYRESFADDEQKQLYQAFATYSKHPECLSEDYKKKMYWLSPLFTHSIGGFPPFSMFDSKNRDLLFPLARVRSKSVCIVPDIAFTSLFNAKLLNRTANVDVVLLSDMISVKALKALFPNPSTIHKVQCFSQTNAHNAMPINQEIQIENCNPWFISIDLRLLTLSATVAEKMSVKRSAPTQGNKRICFKDDVFSVGGDMVRVCEDLLERVKAECEQV